MSDPIGMVVSPREYDFVSKALIAIADQAKIHNNTDAYAAIKSFVVRLKQHTFSGEGVPKATLDDLVSKVSEAFAEGDFAKAQSSMSALVAAVVRMDPDPASVIAMHIGPNLVEMAAQSAVKSSNLISAQAMRQFAKRIRDTAQGFDERGWPKGEDALKYIADTADFCAEVFDDGNDPFTQEEDGT